MQEMSKKEKNAQIREYDFASFESEEDNSLKESLWLKLLAPQNLWTTIFTQRHF